jgi:hypothetical protein
VHFLYVSGVVLTSVTALHHVLVLVEKMGK